MVTVNGARSDLVTVPCWIPQGSVLGSILFLLYINDFYKFSSLLDFHSFAADANLFYRHRDISILRQHINTELKCKQRLCSNKLSLNIEKSSYVIFHPSQKKNDVSSEGKSIVIDFPSEDILKVFKNTLVSLQIHIYHGNLILVYLKKMKRSLGIFNNYSWRPNESIAHEAESRMGYSLGEPEGDRNNCISNIFQPVGQKSIETKHLSLFKARL